MTSPMTACSLLTTMATTTSYFIPVPKSPDKLTHVYYVIHRERYGIDEIIAEGIISNPSPNCSLEFKREWIERYSHWNLTIQGLKQQEKCFKITATVTSYLSVTALDKV